MRYIPLLPPVKVQSIDGTPVVLDVFGTNEITMEHFIHTRLKDPIFGQNAEAVLAVVRIVTALRDAVKEQAQFFALAEEDFALLETATRTPSAEITPTGNSTRYSPQLALSIAPFIVAVLGAGTAPPQVMTQQLGN